MGLGLALSAPEGITLGFDWHLIWNGAWYWVYQRAWHWVYQRAWHWVYQRA